MSVDPAPSPHATAEQVAAAREDPKLVVGHAVRHHIPDVPATLREMLRVLRPGGRFVFAGEPTRIGDRYARKLGQLTWWTTTTLTRLPPLRGEAAVPPGRLGVRWANFAYRTWLALSALDERALSRVLPRSLGYNVLITGRRPAPDG